MVKEIRIYVEGGGDSRSGKAEIRKGFSRFLDSFVQMARNRRIRWSIIACGGRESTIDRFRISLVQHDQAMNVLLVDSEGPVSMPPENHLRQESWSFEAQGDYRCHLMVQVMESWFLADVNCLARFYGEDFHSASIGNVGDVESITKEQVEQKLKNATRRTRKGAYHKIEHGPKILERLDPKKVRDKPKHCALFLDSLTDMLS